MAGGNLRFLLFHAAWVCHEHILHVYNFQKRKVGKKQRDSDSSSFQCVSYELLTLSGSVSICVEIDQMCLREKEGTAYDSFKDFM